MKDQIYAVRDQGCDNVPENAEPGTEDKITITATSHADNKVSDNASCVARSVAATPGVNVSISPSQKGGVPGAALKFTVTVKNTGNVIDNYDLVVEDNAGWDPTLDDNLLENVAPGENRTTGLTVTIPDNENLIGMEDTVTVTATSQENVEVSDNASCIVYAGEENTFYLDLVAGWNLVGFPVTNENTTPENLFAGTSYTMYYWVAPYGPYKRSFPNQPVELSVGYWVKLTQNMTITVPL